MHVSTDINRAGYGISKRRGGGSAVAKNETQLQNAIRVELSKIGIVRRNNVGTFYTKYGVPIVIGIPGEADLTLFMKTGEKTGIY